MAQNEKEKGESGEIATVLGRIPSGLFVVTWLDPLTGGDRGMLASWVMQAGFEPPAISLAVAPSRGIAAAIEAGVPFVVNLLAESQRGMVGRFGRPATPPGQGGAGGYDPFDGLAVERAPCGAAILSPASGWLECVGEFGINAADHRVVVANVRKAGSAVIQPAGSAVIQPAGSAVIQPAGSAVIQPAGRDDAPIVHIRKNGLRY